MFQKAPVHLILIIPVVLILLIQFSLVPAAAAPIQIALTLSADWDPDKVSMEEKSTLQQMVQQLKKDLSVTVTVTGHTDTFGIEQENFAIGFFYASRIADHLVDRFGFPRERLLVDSRGETTPVVSAGSFESQAPNRRVLVGIGDPAAAKVQTQAPRKVLGKNVLILEPAPGTVDRAYQKVKAIVEGSSQTALLTINGISSLIAVQESRIDTEVVLERGDNTIEVMAWDDSGAFGKDEVAVSYVPPPPEIRINTPRDGQVFDTTHSPVIGVTGKIEAQTTLSETFLFLNGAPHRIEVDEEGNFSQPVVLIRRNNRIRVEAVDIYGTTDTSEDITVSTINLAPKEMVVYLIWDQPGVDLDLHIYGPDDQHTYYGALDPPESSEAIPEGALDLDDKDGFGPEVFSMTRVSQGIYDIVARYHHSPESKAAQAQLTVVLYPTEPARRITRVFGPMEMGPGAVEDWFVARISLPEGAFLPD
ncbi:MAG: OmpA family protein [bacterium]|nr:OmpA family protein [bacterium]